MNAQQTRRRVALTVVALALTVPLTAHAESVSYKIATGGIDHFDSRFAVAGYVRGQSTDGANLLYGLDGAYEGMGGFVPSFLYVYGRAGLTMTGMGDRKTTGINVKGRAGLGSRKWTAVTQRVVLKSESYSTGTSTVTTTTYIDVPFVPGVTERAYYAGLELMHMGGYRRKLDSAGKQIGKEDFDQAMLLSVGSHNGFSTDWLIDTGSSYGTKTANNYVSVNMDFNVCVNGEQAVGLGAALELDLHWKYFNMRFDLGGNQATGGYMALALGPAFNMNPRGKLLPYEDGYLDDDDAKAEDGVGARPEDKPSSELPPAVAPTPAPDAKPAPAPAPTPAPPAPAPTAPGAKPGLLL